MGTNFWIKLYHEVLHDPKMGRLPDNVWRRAIELFLLAGELDEDGKLPDTEDIAWLLHRPNVEELETELVHLEKVKILTRLEDGSWLVTKFSDRQKAIGDAERAKAYRDRKRKGQAESRSSNEPDTLESQERHEPVTNRDADRDIDKDRESEGGNPPPAPISESIRIYQEVTGLRLNKAIWGTVIQEVDGDSKVLARWKDTVTAWIARGYNPGNIDGMIDRAKQDRLPTNKNGPGPPVAGSGPKLTPEQLEGYHKLMEDYGDSNA
jgi:hypothetical protein